MSKMSQILPLCGSVVEDGAKRRPQATSAEGAS